jgi:hypothetical protein
VVVGAPAAEVPSLLLCACHQSSWTSLSTSVTFGLVQLPWPCVMRCPSHLTVLMSAMGIFQYGSSCDCLVGEKTHQFGDTLSRG